MEGIGKLILTDKLYELGDNREILSQAPYNLEIKKLPYGKYGEFVLFKYSQTDSDFSNEVVKEARGIIYYHQIDGNLWSIVCHPFDKFFNHGEQYADNIDWKSARVQEKIDGSLIKMWYRGKRMISTNGNIDAFESPVGETDKNFGELFQEGLANEGGLNISKLNQNYTYMFELVGPYNKVVINYPTTQVYHIGTRNNITGKELDVDIGIQKPKEYLVGENATLDMVLKEREKFNDLHEGFVVVDKYYHRIKVKTDEYVKIHHMFGGIITDYKIIDLIQSGDTEEYLTYFPEEKERVDNMKSKMAQCKITLTLFRNHILTKKQEYLDKYQDEREAKKHFALDMKDNKNAGLGFYVWDGKLDLDNLDYKKYI